MVRSQESMLTLLTTVNDNRVSGTQEFKKVAEQQESVKTERPGD